MWTQIHPINEKIHHNEYIAILLNYDGILMEG